MNKEAVKVQEASPDYFVEANELDMPSGFKKTEVGLIPEDWGLVAVGDLFSFKNGLNKAKRFFGYGTPIVNYMDVFQSPGLWSKDIVGRVDVDRNELKAYEVRKGDVFFTRTSETVEEVGVTSVMLDAPTNAVFSGFVLRARALDDSLVDDYKKYCFTARYFRQQVTAKASYTTRALTNGRALSSALVARPPKAEQLAIAEALSDADNLISALDTLIAKKRAIKQSTIQQLLTGKTRLPGFNGEWETKRLGEVGECLRGVSYNPDSDLSLYDTDTTIRLLRANNIQSSAVTTIDLQYVNFKKVSKMQIMRENDILICMANGSKELVGKAALFNIEDGYLYTFGAFMGCFRTFRNKSNPIFCFYLLQTHRFRNIVGVILAGSSINNLKPSDIELAEFLIPDKEEQDAIAAVLSQMDIELSTLEQRREKTRALKQGMMQQLLTGRIRLKVGE